MCDCQIGLRAFLLECDKFERALKKSIESGRNIFYICDKCNDKCYTVHRCSECEKSYCLKCYKG